MKKIKEIFLAGVVVLMVGFQIQQTHAEWFRDAIDAWNRWNENKTRREIAQIRAEEYIAREKVRAEMRQNEIDAEYYKTCINKAQNAQERADCNRRYPSRTTQTGQQQPRRPGPPPTKKQILVVNGGDVPIYIPAAGNVEIPPHSAADVYVGGIDIDQRLIVETSTTQCVADVINGKVSIPLDFFKRCRKP